MDNSPTSSEDKGDCPRLRGLPLPLPTHSAASANSLASLWAPVMCYFTTNLMTQNMLPAGSVRTSDTIGDGSQRDYVCSGLVTFVRVFRLDQLHLSPRRSHALSLMQHNHRATAAARRQTGQIGGASPSGP
jgi:hypothetical protein